MKALTDWRTEEKQHQQKRNKASKQRHSQTGEQKMGNISRREKKSRQVEALTNLRAKDRQHEQKISRERK